MVTCLHYIAEEKILLAGCHNSSIKVFDESD
jgi:WD40 repeat protein